MPIRTVLASALLLISLCANALAEDQLEEAFTDVQITFFESKVRPILANHCYSCHSHEAKRNKGGFYLDSRAGILDAFLAEPGNADPEVSMLIKAVRYEDADYAMPPKGKLPDNVIKDLEKWVEMGMPWPEEKAAGEAEVFDLEERRKSHWAWQPPKRSGDKSIDVFLAERLAKEGLKPAPLADRATLIRRVTLDLTGIPPTTQEIQAFVDDDSPEAYEHLVDRLLDSPRYGETWGRHWLDMVRYAESYGHEFDINIPHAWKYRDYIIRALNDDIPYNRVVKEHIAGDLIEPRIHPETKVNEAVVATGWWFMHEQTHSPTDVRLHEHDRMDNQIDVMSKSFMGMTVSCARCHDHKFDAISDEDFYSLMGFLQSSRQHEAYLDHGGKIDKQIKAVKEAVAQGQQRFETLNAPELEPTTTKHDQSVLFEDFNSGTFDGWLATGWAWGDKPTVPGQWDPTSGKAAAVMPGVVHSGLLGKEVMGTLRSPEFDYDQQFAWVRVKGKGQIRMIIDSYTLARDKPLLFEDTVVDIDTKGEWQWAKVGARRSLYAGKTHESKAGDGTRFDHRAHLQFVDDHADAHLIIDEVRFGQHRPANVQPPVIASARPEADKAFAKDTKRFAQAAKQIPKPQRALAITDGSPDDTYLHIRGGWRGIGEKLPRRFLTALGGEDGTPPPTTGSGRDDLARRMVDPSNPLAARVRVNRLWHHLFGRGISPTVDNFGVLGVEPSHPDLLDHLAIVFMEEDNWSNKAMIKRIVMTEAYRRSSDKFDPQAEEKDPLNVLLHRQNIRRMTAEMIRDAMLTVSGSLNEKRFGPPVPVYLTSQMQGRGRPKNSGPLDGNGRRSIYVSVRRNFLSPMMLTFDTPIPFSTVGKRNVTNVPAQSLTLMNDPFVHGQAKKWAERLVEQDHATPDDRLDAIFSAIKGRAATEQEHDAAVAFLSNLAKELNVPEDRLMSDARLWQQMCHVAFNLKSFIYIR